ncbi:hypothetical protein A2356_03740 [Candidatus Nomurabacteria bacterium RIFOXYB1_FULL_39_16]|uniref:Transmembrane protein n=2 Tax=Candidatus Nomuraibacteriota TaxID=1752729 RepID=A0A0G0QN60_9BACT|nr:MAG: hypothetical protein UT78_C0019G0014 [Candidatus Nomurabacteria bacterium GW2011_GWF2_40_12]OGJ09193.1 MAG: hypothetical protein A2356_03740 [Candidatus Nomurabacteria bacterium RIFOXYB1_FULL_39_16]OGJ15102.1 MAG: hypothetical protein A2585_00690 [Candidatus Nomurabacteria bacterium RIFOXYD1_FULL_39_12]
MEHFRKNFFPYILILLTIAVGITSYSRLFINQDYLVEYEGECDPIIEECFVGCEDDECTEEYYYTQIIKYAPDLYKQCGKDITDCESANICLPDDKICSITYCDIETDKDICELITKEQDIEDNNEEYTEEPLLENNTNDNI